MLLLLSLHCFYHQLLNLLTLLPLAYLGSMPQEEMGQDNLVGWEQDVTGEEDWSWQ